MARLAALLLAALACGACASYEPPEDVHDTLQRAMHAAQSRQAAGYHAEAAVLALAIEDVDPDFPGLDPLRDGLDRSIRGAMSREWLGSNRRLRPQVSRPVWQQVLLYVPDRVLDLLDVASVSVQLGTGVLLDVHATHAINATAGLRSSGGIGLHELRSLGMKSQAEGGISLLPFGAYSYAGGLVGTSGVVAAADSVAGLHQPQGALYQELRDYWEIGARVFAGIAGADVAVHPVQIVDFVAGFATIDLLNDDFARTRGLDQSQTEERLVRSLWAVRRSRRTIDEYLAAKRSGALGTSAYGSHPPRGAGPLERATPREIPAAPEER
jgi:hypothetical protein